MKGIREFVVARFAQFLPQFQDKTLNGAAFRKTVMAGAIEQFQISVASAATHYNFALKGVKETNPTSVEGLGRPDDKKGGRKPVHMFDVVKVKDNSVVAGGLSKAKADELVTLAASKGKVELEARPVGWQTAAVADDAATTEVAADAEEKVAETA